MPPPTTPPTPPSDSTKGHITDGQEALSPSDQQWLDRLSDKLTQVNDPQALIEADLLRAAILREQAACARLDLPSDNSDADTSKNAKPPSTSADQAGAERLMFALRREGLLPKNDELDKSVVPKVDELTKAALPRWMMPSALAASVLVGFFALQALQLGQSPVQYDEPPTMRGQIQEIAVRDKTPKAKAEAIAGKLKEAGLSARIYQLREQFVVDTDLIPEKLDSAAKTLAELGIESKTGQARITVQKPE